jgi:hypothetical protein
MSPRDLASRIEKDFLVHQQNFTIFCNDDLDSILKESVQEEKKIFSLIDFLPFSLHLYQHQQLIYWNKSDVSFSHLLYVKDSLITESNNTGFYILYNRKINDSITAQLIYTARTYNSYKSEHISEGFTVLGGEVDYNMDIKAGNIEGGSPITLYGNIVASVVEKSELEITQESDGWVLFFHALPFICFGISIHTYYKVRVKYHRLKIFGLLLLTVILVRGLNLLYGFPTDYSYYTIFNPEYFATDFLNKSLGDVFINMCLVFWILLFFILNIQNKVYDISKSKIKYFYGVVVILFNVLTAVYLRDLGNEIVVNSTIHFDLQLLSVLNFQSFVMLLTFLVIFGNFLLICLISYFYYIKIFKHALYIPHIFYLIAYGLLFYNTGHFYISDLCLVLILMLSQILFRMPSLKVKFDFNSYSLLVWMILISLIGSWMVSITVTNNEKRIRTAFAERLFTIKDTYSESKFEEFIHTLEQDSTFVKCLFNPSESEKLNLFKSYSKHHYTSPFRKYQVEFHVLRNNFSIDSILTTPNSNSNSILLATDTLPILNRQCLSFITATSKGYILLVNNFAGRGMNIAIKLFKPLLSYEGDYYSFLYIDNYLQTAKSYSYHLGVYKHNKLIAKNGNYPFPKEISPNVQVKDNNPHFLNKNNNMNEMWHHIPALDITLCVARQNRFLLMFSTLFGYSFIIYFVVITLYILGNIIARSKFKLIRFLNLLVLIFD